MNYGLFVCKRSFAIMKDFLPHKPTERVLDILELLSQNHDGLPLSKIASLLSIPKGTLSPIIHTLNKRNFLSYNSDAGPYSISLHAYLVGETFASQKSAFQYVHEQMSAIVNRIDEICQLGILDQGNVLYISKVDSKEPIRLLSYVGKKLPAYATALGKALISPLNESDLRQLYPMGLHPLTPYTITDFHVLAQELDTIKTSSIAHEKEESMAHLECFAVPLFSGAELIASISVSVPMFRLSNDKSETIKQTLLSSKQAIESYFASQSISKKTFLSQSS